MSAASTRQRWISAEKLHPTVRRERSAAGNRPKPPPKPTVPMASKHTTLPGHMRHTTTVLRANIEALHRFADDLPALTIAEVHASSTRLNALLRAQSSAVDDMATFTASEVRMSKETIGDLTAHVLEAERSDVGAQVQACRAVYQLLYTTSTLVGAADGFVLLAPKAELPRVAEVQGPASQTELRMGAASAPYTSPAAPITDQKKLRPIAHVSHKPIPGPDAGVPRDVYALCTAVAKHICAANVTAKTVASTASCREMLVCPIMYPGHPTTVLGVVAMAGKRAAHSPTAAGPEFSAADEMRVTCAAEQLAVMLSTLPVGLAESGNVALTPPTFQAELQRWSNGGLRLENQLPSQPEEPPRRFILRTEQSGTALVNLLRNRARQPVWAPDVLADLVGRLEYVEKELADARRRFEAADTQVARLSSELAETKDEQRTAERDATDMRIACERVLRLAYMQQGPAAGELQSIADGLPQRTAKPPGGSSVRAARSASRVPHSPRRESTPQNLNASVSFGI